MKRLVLLAAALLLAALVWFFWRRPAPEAVATSPVPTASVAPHADPTALPPPPAAAEVSHLADRLNVPGSDIRADLHIVAAVLDTFRSNFPHEGNPVGSNPEITAVLTGKNKLHLALIPPGHPAIDAQGQLCDRWGTPFFFHAESGAKMEIRSAGPDKKMWTADDVVLSP